MISRALEEAIADLEQQMQDSARDYTALNGIIKEKEERSSFGRKRWTAGCI